MTIAFKSGKPIIKDGKLATNCGCCQSVVCDTDWSQVSGVTVEITDATGDYVGNTRIVDSAGREYKHSVFFYMQHFNGTHVLSKEAGVSYALGKAGSRWSIPLAVSGSGCPTSGVIFDIADSASTGLHAALRFYEVEARRVGVKALPGDTSVYQDCTEDIEFYTDPDLGCESDFSASPCVIKTYTQELNSPMASQCVSNQYEAVVFFDTTIAFNPTVVFSPTVPSCPDGAGCPVYESTLTNSPASLFVSRISIETPSFEFVFDP